MELDKKPHFKAIEKKWQDFWEKEGIYKFDPKSKKPVYSIDTPPPYASNEHLHMGHALHYTQFEIISRIKRMQGNNVYFAPCFDNNGLPTEKYIEEKFNISKGSMPRDEFVKLCRKEAARVENGYSERFFKALGHGYDWSLLYTTIDPEAQKVSQTSFLDLIKKGLAYRAEEPVQWCPNHQTALAQAEVEDKERKTTLNYLNFDLKDGSKIEIATTRPEFLPACVGIFVHPEDKRYTKLVGKKAIVPLFGQKVPIMADEKVDMAFGSGIVMICTFGDTTDIEWWKKHKLPLKICITKDGKMNELAGKYQGLDLGTAREAIKDDLEGQGFLIKEEPLEQTVGACWRCGTPVEFIVAPQWFIKTLEFKKEIISQAKKIKWHPAFYRKRLEDWTNNLGWDWIISRQRFYGVPIPVWYCKACNEPVFADLKDLPVDPTASHPKKKCKCGSNEFVPESDVFDTWMTSSMSPEIAVRWLEKPERFKEMFPVSLRPQSHDIIRTWAFYTILKAYLHFKKIPWKEILIGTYVLDEHGKGMHKSKGNAIWLKDILEKYNSDAVRYWVATANLGSDLLFQEKEMIHGYKILIKLWNTARFVGMHLAESKKPKKLEIEDKWILSRLSEATEAYMKAANKYSISGARKALEQFFYLEFCDFYLEMVKHRLYGTEGNENKEAAQETLHTCLLAMLKLFAPFIPHITEEIYQTLFKEKEKSIHLCDFPAAEKVDIDAVKSGKLAMSAISVLRRWKQKKNLSLGAEIGTLTLQHPKAKELAKLKSLIAGTMRIKDLKIEEGKAVKVI